ncbi:multidrug efflux pump [Pseudomonas pohangensis]|uniref:Multidrug efflux pump n=1 Tax=Pseudomonas pohangensis TaxID=364197 RepID=A0A1H2HTS2_9PSED|nr:efflux RND transporter permease subunit [Pseudomonas pohangensis]SDU35272.1 multidrug efflux pump [Pseudomonas pohangensis]
MKILSSAVTHYRSTLSILLLLICVGVFSYQKMPVEAQPRVKVPYVSVTVVMQGASPEDVARLLVRPLEQELRTIENVEEIRAFARESGAAVYVKFVAGATHSDKAYNDVQSAVDRAKSELPTDAEEPEVEELTADDFPAITVVLTADEGTSERLVFRTAQMLQREIEGIDGVLEAAMVGSREEVVEALINPARLEHYNITNNELITSILGNNLLVPAGVIESGQGRFSVKVPGLIETYQDVFDIPAKSTPNGVITLADVADIRSTFKDAEGFSSYNGRPAILLEVQKRTESNQIAVASAVRNAVKALEGRIPNGIAVNYAFDLSEFSLALVEEMRGNIGTAMALVMVIVVGALGFRSGLLVGLGIPFSILFSLIGIRYLGYSFNMMVMFGMILALGMLIDGSIVITEFANRKMAEGMRNKDAYSLAVKRMFWPVVSSTATTLAAFLPLMFWPGVAGDFMGYLPVTVFWVLIGSLLYALFFAPFIGSLLPADKLDDATRAYLMHLEDQDPLTLPGHTGRYARAVKWTVQRPLLFCAVALLAVFSVFKLYGAYNNGVMFFAETEETVGFVSIRAQGNFSVNELRSIVGEVEQRVLEIDGVKTAYSFSGTKGGSRLSDKDEVGSILVELENPKTLGRSTRTVFEEMRQATADMAGIIVSAEVFEGGPPVGKPIQIQLESNDQAKLIATGRALREQIENNIEGVRNVTDTTPLPGIEWEIQVDRARAAQMGVNVIELGRAVQLVTTGVLLSEYRPTNTTEEVEIRVRYPLDARGLGVLDELRINTPDGAVPVSSFVTRVAKPKVDKIERLDAIDIIKVQADMQPGFLADNAVRDIKAWLVEHPLDPGVQVVFRGANEEQEDSQAFLAVAFLLALFLMFVLLVTQFNSFYQAFLTLTAVVTATGGVLLGLLITGSTFSTILTGVGVVALAGIVVNNNIILIDTYNVLRVEQPGLTPVEAAVRTCAQRLRPIFLTTATTILGLIPIAIGVSIDIVSRQIVVDGVVTSYFRPVAEAIVSGLFFATLMTLFFTPAMLVLPERLQQIYQAHIRPHLPKRKSSSAENKV